jgi:hypothetical protein
MCTDACVSRDLLSSSYIYAFSIFVLSSDYCLSTAFWLYGLGV